MFWFSGACIVKTELIYKNRIVMLYPSSGRNKFQTGKYKVILSIITCTPMKKSGNGDRLTRYPAGIS